jgi:RNA polymerase sigma-70 factor, ECF subfamily
MDILAFPFSPNGFMMTDKELTDGLVFQRKEAIQYLVDKYQNHVTKTAFYFVGNMEDAEDLSQEVFLEIFKSIGRFKQNSSLYTWIYRITVNKSLDHLRRQKRRSVLHQLGAFLKVSNDETNGNYIEPAIMDTQNEDREKRVILDRAVNSLSENQRIAFILNKYEDMAYREIAEIMNLSLSSVESLIHRAKLNLQKKLVNHFSEYASKNK